MIEDTIRKIEARLEAAESVRPERRDELMELLRSLRDEVAELHVTHRQQAERIAGLTESCATEATQAVPDPKQLDMTVESLNSSVQGFENSHPRLVQLVNSISQTLANLGI